MKFFKGIVLKENAEELSSMNIDAYEGIEKDLPWELVLEFHFVYHSTGIPKHWIYCVGWVPMCNRLFLCGALLWKKSFSKPFQLFNFILPL